MKFLRHLWYWLRRHKLESDLEEELRQHLEWKAEQSIAQGVSSEEAWRLAHLEFGNAALAHERARRRWGFPRLESVYQDVRFGLRQLRKHPGFTAVAVLTLALGIGANSAMFSLVNVFLLSSLPAQHPEELVAVRTVPGSGFEQKAYELLRDHSRTLAGLIAWDDGNIAVDVDGSARIERVDFVSANSYSILGVLPYRGRVLAADDDVPGKAPVTVISYAYWQSRFGLDPAAVGKKVRFKDLSCTIVGVAPPWFHGLRIGGASVPFTLPARWHQRLALKDNNTFDLFGRLARGADMAAAEAELGVIYRQAMQANAGKIKDSTLRQQALERRIKVVPAKGAAQAFDGRFALELRLVQAVVGLVLLIACVNLTNLLLARGNSRRREIGVRLALGAPPSRVMRQLLTENLILALCGGALGLLISTELSRILLKLLNGSLDIAALGAGVDTAVLGFTAGVSALSGLLFGLIPAWRCARNSLNDSLRGADLSAAGGPGHTNRILVAPQIAVSLVVLTLCGLLLRSLENLHHVDLNFEHDHLLSFWMFPTLSGYDGEKELQLYDRVLAGLNQLPGVRVASMSRLSLLHRGKSQGLKVDGASLPDVRVVYAIAAPRLFETLGLPLLSGRDFSAQDNQRSPGVAIVNEATAMKFFPNQNPLGHRIAVPGREPEERTIVGVVRNMRFSLRNDMPTEGIYIPYAQAPDDHRGQALIKISTAAQPESMIPAIEREVHLIAPNMPPVEIEKEDDIIGDETSQEGSLSQLLGAFGGLAVCLTLLGLYGSVSYSVSQRIREIAIRLALGAQHGMLLRMIVAEALRVVFVGAAAGLVLAALASRALKSFLFGVHNFDALTYLAVITSLLVAATIAAYLPAQRATAVDPMIVLRHE